MKKIFIALGLLLGLCVQMQAEDKLTVEEFTIAAGEQKVIYMSLENQGTYTAFQCNLTLPEGVTIQEDGGMYYVLPVEERLKQNSGFQYYTHTVEPNKLADGSYNIFVYSGNTLNIVGNSGPVLVIGIEASDAVSTGNLKAKLKDVKLAIDGNNGVYPADAEFDCTVQINAPVTAAGYATFSWPTALDFTGLDVDAYIGVGSDYLTSGELSLQKVEKVPANTGLILIGSEGTYHPQTITDDECEGVSDNQLRSTASGDVAATGSELALGSKSSSVGFYKVQDGVTIPQYHAYLEGNANARMVSIEGMNTTGITAFDEVTNGNGEDVVFSLKGQRVTSPGKGVYIINGKTTIVK